MEAVQLRDAWTEWTATLGSWKHLETLGFDRTDLAGMKKTLWNTISEKLSEARTNNMTYRISFDGAMVVTFVEPFVAENKGQAAYGNSNTQLIKLTAW